MKNLFQIGVILIFCLFSLVQIHSLTAREDAGLNIEIEVISKASLSISASALGNLTNGDLNISFGDIDAFGIHHSNGVLTEETSMGMAYYTNLKISAGTTGGIGSGFNLRVSLLNSTPSLATFFEAPGSRLIPGQTPETLRTGQVRTIQPNVSGFKSFERILGVMVKPETSAGNFSAQIRYSLENGG